MKLRLLAMLFNFSSMSAVAGYHCNLQLTQSEDFHKIIAEKTISISAHNIKSGSFGTLFVESQTNRKKISLDVNAVMNGWTGDEDAVFVILRRETKKHSVNAQAISEKIFMEGDEVKKDIFFDSYKLNIACHIKE